MERDKQMSIPLTHSEDVSIKDDFLYTLHKPYSFREGMGGVNAYFIEDGRGLVVAGVIRNIECMPSHAPQSESKDMANYICHMLNKAE
jgi:hypothetical protein